MNKLEMANPFYNNLDSPDEKKEPKQEDSVIIPGLEGLLRKYEKVLEIKGSNFYIKMKKHIQTIDDILTPEQINSFLQITIKYEKHNNYQDNTGDFISKLIQNSYDAGYNNFILNTKTLKEIHDLGNELKGKKNEPIEITIKGNTGEGCGYQARHSNFHIEGNAGDECGSSSKYSNFKIKGNTGDYYGDKAKHSNFKVQGNIGDKCGNAAQHSNFYMHKNFGKEIGGVLDVSYKCTFTTYKKNLYKRLLREFFYREKTNKAILKDKNGNIIEEKLI